MSKPSDDELRERAEASYPCTCHQIWVKNGRHDPVLDCPDVQDAILAVLTRVRDETAVEVERLRELLDDAFVMSRIEPHKYRKQRADEIRALAARE